MNEFIFIRSKGNFIKGSKIEERYSKFQNGEGSVWFFNGPNDQVCLSNLKKGKQYIVCIVNFIDNKTPNKMFLGYGERREKEDNFSLVCKLEYKTEREEVINSILESYSLDIETDFDDDSYVTCEKCTQLVKIMNQLMNKPKTLYSEKSAVVFSPIEDEEALSELAQKNQYILKEYSIFNEQTDRGEFQRDYERITHSKSFRRLVDKAQIFSANKGDHYRTRMTHTLSVNQIARGIAKELNLNLYLTEAIAIGHDLGHTPFGHQGERTIDDILKGEYKVLTDTDGNILNYGGFKHNYHSLKVANVLEEAYLEFDGLDLSFQTLDGMLKHTKTDADKFSISDFASEKLCDYLKLNSENPNTLEGQVVKIADEIAQRSHDLEDAFAANKLSVFELKEYTSLRKSKKLYDEIVELEQQLSEVNSAGRLFIDMDELLQSRIASKIIHFFIKDVVENAKVNIAEFIKLNSLDFFKENNYIITELLIDFSKETKKTCEYLETIISKKVINSSEVALFDNTANKIVRFLFQEYYANPKLLHIGTQKRLFREFRRKFDSVVTFEEGSPALISAEWGKIINCSKLKSSDLLDLEYQEKNRILVRCIVDFIAGMTDSYAKNEYNRLNCQ